ncbi:unnamed protein product [Withania somnifera]
MGAELGLEKLLLLFLVLISIRYSEELQSSQVQTLVRIQHLLNYPTALKSWNNETDFCKIEPSATLTVVCYDENITQLQIIGRKGTSSLPRNFSIRAFLNALAKLPSLKVLRLVSLGLWGPLPGNISRLSALEILDLSSNYFHSGIPQAVSSLMHLQTLMLDGNRLTGRIPDGLGSLSGLAVLSVKSNLLNGSLPDTLRDLNNLRILSLSRNNFSGEVPDLSSLENLQVLELEDNSFGPKFPQIGSKIESIALRNNKFTASIPEKVQSYYQLEHFDISSNNFLGPFPPSLLSLSSITYLNVAGNKLTGMLFEDNPCNTALDFVDLSANLLTGTLPSCLLSSSRNRIVHFSNNCLATEDGTQHPFSFCRNGALAVGVIPHHQRQPASKVILALIICGSFTGGVILLCLTVLIVKSFLAKKAAQNTPTRFHSEDASSSYTSKLFTDARYITQAMKLGALSLPSYRTFSLEELEAATNNFDTTNCMGEILNGQMYRGQMRDGSYVTIRCLIMKRSNTSQNFMHHIELMSKLRHQHLVSALGHCFQFYLDDSSVSRIFLIFEYVPNGTLRRWISEKHARRKLTWAQRIAAATGVAKGLQFLHNGIIPGLYSNNLKITDISLDQNLVAKISSYNLPFLSENVGKEYCQTFPVGYNQRGKYEEKLDVYDFGVLLLEIITGRQINTKNDILALKNQLQVSITGNEANVVDVAIRRSSCSAESLRTMVELCCRCLCEDPVDRPSMDDVLWNLQFTAQAQDDYHSSLGSPISPLQPSGQLVIR